MAPAGQKRTQTPQPSQRMGSTRKARGPGATAPKRHRPEQSPQQVQASGSMTASCPEWNACSSWRSGESSRCRSGASTSRSQITECRAKSAKAAVSEVLPVPPLPLTTTSSFMALYSFPAVTDARCRRRWREIHQVLRRRHIVGRRQDCGGFWPTAV